MPIPLEKYFRDMNNLSPDPIPNLITPNFDGLNKDTFSKNFQTIIQMPDHDISIFIKNNIDMICDDILNNNIQYASLFENDKFSTAFIKAVNSIPITLQIQLACNKITYDYFTSENPQMELKKKYLNMSKAVNRDAINRLMQIGLDENTASNLAMCRYSSSNEKVNSDRLNFSMYFRDPEIMSEQMVVWIYEKFFNRLSDLFQATMFDVYTSQQLDDFGENFVEVYGTVGNAVLLILNNMTTENIKKVLSSYSIEWNYKGRPSVRFSLHALSNDYSRVSRVVEMLKVEGKMVP